MLALRLIIKDKGGKQHCLPFVGSNLGVEICLKKREYRAQQIARTVTSVRATCTQRGYRVHVNQSKHL